MPILEVKNLTLRFGGLTAVNNLSFDIEENSIMSLIGPNGAGKTSAFNCLTGFYKGSEGDILFQGRTIFRQKPYKITKMGMARTFQNLRLFKDMTVLENVMSGMHSRTSAGVLGAVLRLPSQRQEEKKIRQVSEECLDFVGILDKKDRLARNLAYGDQRRVEWARALATHPKLILLDEPAAGLNHDEKDQLVDLIHRIRKDLGITVLLIEHDMGLVMKVSEKIVVIDYGQKIAEGTSEEVKNNPRVIEAYLGKEDEE
ncbi:amino acid/amide ABC transporter ATP-binding protein 1, HAAT family [Desulfosporosinus acidiphilus SJ4]|uniref:Amino acid/amide ABC transporter ATP-binding protein 1, HAAT family n=1 Tax=Desulfosporosinus acidiphilus (strain DSM 22704 / JCM 16185 / SJ4) TaxID=646529 RepID=I4D330_DESAJ|nr:ABC transporter ATP-binding protein [Desulfosporosinus acidiphilus]AFM40204.1 amino acid/amide ABC transporter ATP-binding protein 1, HAAT family [Desulfosporosinus acidiphilus SJ4]